MNDRHPIWQLADQIQMDLRAAQGKLIELRSQLSALGELPDTNRRENASPTDPYLAILREINNGAIVDDIDLQAAIRAAQDRGHAIPDNFTAEAEAALPRQHQHANTGEPPLT